MLVGMSHFERASLRYASLTSLVVKAGSEMASRDLRSSCIAVAKVGAPSSRALIPARYDPRGFHHKDYRSFRGAGAVHDAFRNHKSLFGQQLNRPVFRVDQEAPLDDVKELVFEIVLVPVELALHDAQPHHGLIHPAKGLVVPRLFAGVNEPLHIDNF